MAFRDDLSAFTVKVRARHQAAFTGVVAEVHTSIVFGSPLTGSPGQPVADVEGGALRASWTVEFDTPTSAIIGTASPYAPQNEDGIARPGGGPYRLLASTGGRWSVRSTINAFQRIVNQVTRDLGASGR